LQSTGGPRTAACGPSTGREAEPAQDSIHQRQELEKKGEVLRRRAESHLKGSFGFTSDDLVQFGISPRKTGPRGPNKKPPVQTPPPAVK